MARTSKKAILEGYETAKTTIKEKDSATFNPDKETKEKAKKKVVETANKFSKEFSTSKFAQEFNGLVEKIDTLITELDNLDQCISLKQAEIKELYDIDTEAGTLFALATAKDELIAKKELEIIELTNKYNLTKKELEERRVREEEEYKYELERRRMIDENEYDDKCKEKEKEFNSRLDVELERLNTRRKEVHEETKQLEARRQELGDIEEKFKALQDSIDKEARKATAIAEARLNKDHENTLALKTLEFAGEKLLLNNTITNLEKANEVLKQENDTLAKKLETSYEKINDMASKALDSSTNAKIISNLEHSLKQFGSGFDSQKK